MTVYALLVSDFLDTVASLLQVMVALLGPSMAIYAADILLRRNRYDGRDLSDQTRTGPFWYTAGVNWAGATALIAGTAVASQCLATPFYTGPIARAAGGTDLSPPGRPPGVGLRLLAHDAFPPYPDPRRRRHAPDPGHRRTPVAAVRGPHLPHVNRSGLDTERVWLKPACVWSRQPGLKSQTISSGNESSKLD